MVILLYHDIVKESSQKRIYSVTEENFRKHLLFLKENNYRVLSLGELIAIIKSSSPLPKKSAVITFDDGTLSQFEVALPTLREAGFSACFFINVGSIGTPGYMDFCQIRNLLESGMEIGSHGLSHQFLNLMTPDKILYELKKSKEILEDGLDRQIPYFSIPRGSLNVRAIQKLSQQVGYEAMCVSHLGYIDSSTSIFNLKRFPIRRYDTLGDVIQILEHNSWKVFCYKAGELTRDSLKRLSGMTNYERLRRFIFKDEYRY